MGKILFYIYIFYSTTATLYKVCTCFAVAKAICCPIMKDIVVTFFFIGTYRGRIVDNHHSGVTNFSYSDIKVAAIILCNVHACCQNC